MVVKRNTWQREAVREALGTTEGFVSAQTLHAHLREARSPTSPPRAMRMPCSRRARASTVHAPPARTTTT